MPQPIALPNYSHMAIGSQDELIEEDIKMNTLLIICLTISCRMWYMITSMANLERDCTEVMMVAVAMEMRWENGGG